MFTVIIPTLNEEKYIDKILTDLKNQTFQDFEVIVVDAESTDKTIEVINGFKEYFELKVLKAELKGPGVQRNQGAKNAKNDWLIFLDADVRIENNLLEEIRQKIATNDVEFFSIYNKPYPNKPVYRLLLKILSWYSKVMAKTTKPFINEGFFCCNRGVFLKMGGFNPKVLVNEGSVFLEAAVARGAKFAIYKDLFFTLHMRRIEKNGVLNSVFEQIQLGLAHLLNKPLSEEKIAELYPMDDRFR